MFRNDGVIRGVELKLDMAFTGIQALFASTPNVVVDGVSFTFQQLVDKVQALRDPYKKARAAKKELQTHRNVIQQHAEEVDMFLAGLKVTAGSLLGIRSPALTQFGFSPRRDRVKLSVEEKAAKADKMRATREARHTMGSRQKQAIHGDEPTSAAPAAPAADATKKTA